MQQVARAYYGLPVADPAAPPAEGPQAMAAPTWNMVPDGGGGGPIVSQAPAAPLVSQAPAAPLVSAPPPPAPLVSQDPPAPAPEEPRVPVSAGLAPKQFNLQGLIAAHQEATKTPIYGPAPGTGGPAPEPKTAAPGGSDANVSISSPGFQYQAMGGGGGARVVEQDRLGPKAHALLDQGFGAENQGVVTGLNVIDAQAQAEQAALARRAEQIQSIEDATRLAKAQREAELAKLHAEMKADADQVGQATIDNDRIFSSKGGMNKGLSMIGIALAGFASGMRGQSGNAALDYVNTQIDRDIAAQKFAHDSRLKGFDAKQSAYKMALEKYGQADVAENMARVYMLDKYAAETQKMMSQSKNAATQAQGAELLGKLENGRDNYLAQALQLRTVGGGGRTFRDPRTGLVYTEAELKKKYDAQEMETVKTSLEMTKDIGKAKAEGKAGEKLDQAAQTMAEKIAPLDSAISVFDRAISKLEPQTDAKGNVVPALSPVTTGERVARSGYIPGVKWVYDKARSKTEQQRSQDVDAAMNALLQMKSGAGITESDLVRFNAQLKGAGSNEELLHGLKSVRDEVAEKKKAFAAGNVAGYRQYESNKEQLSPKIVLEPRK